MLGSKIFMNGVKYIDDQEHCKINKKNKLIFLYYISYIKYYCYQLCKLLTSTSNHNTIKTIIESISTLLDKPSPFRKIVKLYILKVLNITFFGRYSEFLDFIKKYKLFIDDFDFNEKNPCVLNYLFIQNDTIDIYKNLRKMYINSKRENYNIYSDKIIEIIKKSDSLKSSILVFYDLLINEEISNSQESTKNNKKLINFINTIFKELNLTVLSQKIVSSGFRINSQIKSSKNVSQENEILLYSNKFAFICLLSENKDSFYSKLMSSKAKKYLENLYIPGGEPNDSLMIESGDQIEKFFKNGTKDGVYMCSCYAWYRVGGCGLPMEVFTCRNCKQQIGGNDHKMVIRKGHFRICYDRQQLNYSNSYKCGPCVMFEDFMKNVEKKRNDHIKGFKQVERRFFMNREKKVRTINNITYRILSFIFYSCIFYDEQLNFIGKRDIHKYYFSDKDHDNDKQNMSILQILSEIWKILNEELLKVKIENIQCFLNMVIPELSNIITNNEKSMKTIGEREEFENLCNYIIERNMQNYPRYYQTYIKNNQEILEIKDDTLKAILQETSNIYNLPKEQYPLINYFYVANYPSYEMFYDQFIAIPDRMDDFPVITNYLKGNENIEQINLLQNFKLINPLITYILEKYNNKISREEAKNRKIKEELESDKKMKDLFLQFRKGWENMYLMLSNYDCHGRLPPKNITEEDSLAFILNDTIEDNYGKYIATVYKDFITYQNEFLKPLIENTSNKQYLYPFVNQVKKAIIVQHATENEIVSLDVKNEKFDSFNDLIFSYSNRNCFEKNGLV
eukprot:jgi/Orpsp1_1/1176915/evm.model.c7180000059477.1